MTSFGKWYEEKKAEENSDASASNAGGSSSWFGNDQTTMLPLFNSDAMQSMSWSNMKASMEAQMPKKILGMGYQQRFKVGTPPYRKKRGAPTTPNPSTQIVLFRSFS